MLFGKVQELNRQLECRDERLAELKKQEIAKLEADRHSAIIVALRQRVADCEAGHSALEGAASHAQQQLAALQQEHDDAQQQILQLQAQIR